MSRIDVLDASGKKTKLSADLDDAVFGIEPNTAVMHQVVTAQLAARRAGTQSTKTRSEVSGGGAKPWKQKGTGRARAGSSRSPIWTGGGVALGPKPRKYDQRTPKKMVRLALRSALSDRAADDKVKVVDFGFDAPSTKAAAKALVDLGISGKVLLVVAADDVTTWKSFRNLTDVHLLVPGELNAYDVLVSDWVVFTPATVPADTPLSRGGQATEEAPAAEAPSLAKAEAAEEPADEAEAPAADETEEES
jgi:large subunit ribosomal protein L4